MRQGRWRRVIFGIDNSLAAGSVSDSNLTHLDMYKIGIEEFISEKERLVARNKSPKCRYTVVTFDGILCQDADHVTAIRTVKEIKISYAFPYRSPEQFSSLLRESGDYDNFSHVFSLCCYAANKDRLALDADTFERGYQPAKAWATQIILFLNPKTVVEEPSVRLKYHGSELVKSEYRWDTNVVMLRVCIGYYGENHRWRSSEYIRSLSLNHGVYFYEIPEYPRVKKRSDKDADVTKEEPKYIAIGKRTRRLANDTSSLLRLGVDIGTNAYVLQIEPQSIEASIPFPENNLVNSGMYLRHEYPRLVVSLEDCTRLDPDSAFDSYGIKFYHEKAYPKLRELLKSKEVLLVETVEHIPFGYIRRTPEGAVLEVRGYDFIHFRELKEAGDADQMSKFFYTDIPQYYRKTVFQQLGKDAERFGITYKQHEHVSKTLRSLMAAANESREQENIQHHASNSYDGKVRNYKEWSAGDRKDGFNMLQMSPQVPNRKYGLDDLFRLPSTDLFEALSFEEAKRQLNMMKNIWFEFDMEEKLYVEPRFSRPVYEMCYYISRENRHLKNKFITDEVLFLGNSPVKSVDVTSPEESRNDADKRREFIGHTFGYIIMNDLKDVEDTAREVMANRVGREELLRGSQTDASSSPQTRPVGEINKASRKANSATVRPSKTGGRSKVLLDKIRRESRGRLGPFLDKVKAIEKSAKPKYVRTEALRKTVKLDLFELGVDARTIHKVQKALSDSGYEWVAEIVSRMRKEYI